MTLILFFAVLPSWCLNCCYRAQGRHEVLDMQQETLKAQPGHQTSANPSLSSTRLFATQACTVLSYWLQASPPTRGRQ